MAGLGAATGNDRAPTLPAALHGRRTGQSTNRPDTIGTKVSSGCFRLVNSDVMDLYDRVPVGTKVVVRQKPEL